jgi:hypothetical protein
MEGNWRQRGYFSPSPPTLLAMARERMIFILSCAEHTLEEARQGRERSLDILQDAGVQDIDSAVISELPLWEQVLSTKQ